MPAGSSPRGVVPSPGAASPRRHVSKAGWNGTSTGREGPESAIQPAFATAGVTVRRPHPGGSGQQRRRGAAATGAASPRRHVSKAGWNGTSTGREGRKAQSSLLSQRPASPAAGRASRRERTAAPARAGGNRRGVTPASRLESRLKRHVDPPRGPESAIQPAFATAGVTVRRPQQRRREQRPRRGPAATRTASPRRHVSKAGWNGTSTGREGRKAQSSLLSQRPASPAAGRTSRRGANSGPGAGRRQPARRHPRVTSRRQAEPARRPAATARKRNPACFRDGRRHRPPAASPAGANSIGGAGHAGGAGGVRMSVRGSGRRRSIPSTSAT